MDVNITKEKKLTNMRAASSDSFENLVPPRRLTLEESLEFAGEDECVEVTPTTVRIRKVILDPNERSRARSRAKRSEERRVGKRVRDAGAEATSMTTANQQ